MIEIARPQKEGMDYFPHDNDAANDEKIEALRVLYGNDGYAFYFILLERIYRTAEFELDVSDAETTQILCRKVAVTEEKFNAMLETALKRKCFDQEAYEQRSVLTSIGIKKRASVVIEKREFMRSKYKKVSDAETTPETREETPQRKGKERLKESKEENISIGVFFESIWSLYPKKKGKGQVSKTQKEKLYKIGIEEMTRAVNRYIQDENRTATKFLQYGSTFFNSGYVDYLDVNYQVNKAEYTPSRLGVPQGNMEPIIERY